MYADTASEGAFSSVVSTPESRWAQWHYRRQDLERDLRRAERNRELEIHYQPKVSLTSGMMRGVEVLLRWRHPILGLIAPAVFLPLAEESGVILEIGQWMIDEVCRQVAEWLEPGIDTTIAINLSRQQVQRSDVAGRVAAAAGRYGVPMRAIELEIAELRQCSPCSVSKLRTLQNAGLRLAVDNIGECHPPMAVLRDLQVDVLKIDRSVVRKIDGDLAMQRRTVEVIQLAKELGLETVAEGVEREAQALCLRELGCDVGQGYFFARPGPIHRLEYWMEGRI